MPEHECIHEVDLALMRANLTEIKRTLDWVASKFDNGIGAELTKHQLLIEGQEKRISKGEKLQWAILTVLILGIAGTIIQRLVA